ncbi:MAG: MerR family transcriptional regulator [Planctomycetota bacterium]|jgi:excisionase family DNA binding protein
MENGTYTSGQVARLCAVSKTTVIRWIDAGRLEAFTTPGGHRRVPATALMAFMKKFRIPMPGDMRATVQ